MILIIIRSYEGSYFAKLPLPYFHLFVVENGNIAMAWVDLLSHRLSDTVSNHFYLVHLVFHENLSCIKVPICSIQ